MLYTYSERRLRAGLAEALGCEMTTAGIKVDPANQRTTVAGVYAAGDVSTGNQVAFAVAGEARAAMFAAFELFYDGLPTLARV
ncbi:FAD-dependent oxidoreductase [Deinococcus sp. Leaf326]|uniref:FAD-dependent oxidoreductase n=1 Tax=Deinococcus sp. Leaf326 TaxID=1736338 RepID=UPI00138F9AAB|nr:FAD-dependent oxidoreductase [Deinococcus sp. Leaf326]